MLNPAQEDAFKLFEEMFGMLPKEKPQVSAPRVRQGHFCNKCDQELFYVEVQPTSGKPRHLFYCVNNHCERFGLLTVVAKLQLVENA